MTVNLLLLDYTAATLTAHMTQERFIVLSCVHPPPPSSWKMSAGGQELDPVENVDVDWNKGQRKYLTPLCSELKTCRG